MNCFNANSQATIHKCFFWGASVCTFFISKFLAVYKIVFNPWYAYTSIHTQLKFRKTALIGILNKNFGR